MDMFHLMEVKKTYMEHMWEMMTFCSLRKPIGQVENQLVRPLQFTVNFNHDPDALSIGGGLMFFLFVRPYSGR